MSAYSQMDTKKNHPLPSKIDRLVDDAKTELNRVGIETEGIRSDEILKQAACPVTHKSEPASHYVGYRLREALPSLKYYWPIC